MGRRAAEGTVVELAAGLFKSDKVSEKRVIAGLIIGGAHAAESRLELGDLIPHHGFLQAGKNGVGVFFGADVGWQNGLYGKLGDEVAAGEILHFTGYRGDPFHGRHGSALSCASHGRDGLADEAVGVVSIGVGSNAIEVRACYLRHLQSQLEGLALGPQVGLLRARRMDHRHVLLCRLLFRIIEATNGGFFGLFGFARLHAHLSENLFRIRPAHPAG